MAGNKRAKPELSADPGDAAGNYGNRRRGGKVRDKSSGGRGMGSSLIMVLLIAAVAVAGWFIANLQQSLDESRASLAVAGDRLAALEARTQETDSLFTEVGVDTSEKIGLWESEIRKLWAVANERNKNWIEGNQKKVKAHDSSLNEIQATLKTLKSGVSRAEQGFAKQQAIIDQITSLDLQIRQILDRQRELTDQVNSSRQTVAALQAGLVSRVEENEDGVASMDNYRRQINARLAEIDQRLQSLGAP